MTVCGVLLLLLLAEPPGGGTGDARTDGDGGDGGAEEETFLSPYYDADSTEAEDEEGGCSGLDGCLETFDVFGLLGRIEVRHHPDPFRHGGVRSAQGVEGSPFGFHASAGVARFGDGDGRSTTVEARLLTPCPAGASLLVQSVDAGDDGEFLLFHAGIPLDLSYGSPLQLSIGPEAVLAREEGRETLAGVGFDVSAGLLFLDGAGVSLDWRLAWIDHLPLQRGEARLSWFLLPAELWAGWGFLRNAPGRMLSGPSAGVGVLL